MDALNIFKVFFKTRAFINIIVRIQSLSTTEVVRNSRWDHAKLDAWIMQKLEGDQGQNQWKSSIKEVLYPHRELAFGSIYVFE